MKLKDIGEFALIENFSKKFFSKPLPKGFVGIGDDCAYIPSESLSKGESIAVSCDMLQENVHFIKDEIGGENLGKKSLAVNLSDLASSGATPLGSFLSVALPEDIEEDFLNNFFKGYAFMSEKYGCPLLGGDTVKSLNGITINVTVLGKVNRENVKLRKNAQPGDFVCVTGFLGDSACGLDFVKMEKNHRPKEADYFISCHHNPNPRLEEGKFLSQFSCVNSMMDISDGISSDLKHILKESQVSAVVELEKLPLSSQMRDYWGFNLKKMYELATSGGEDYELLFTVNKTQFANLNKLFQEKFSKPIYPIGKITEGFSSEIIFLENTNPINGFSNGYDHFTA